MMRDGVPHLWSGLRKLFGKLMPDVADEQKPRASMLLWMGLSFAVAGTAMFVTQGVLSALLAPTSFPWTDLVIDAIVALTGFVAIWLVRSGHIQPVSWLVLGCLFVLTLVQFFSEGNPTAGAAGALSLILFVSMSMVLLERLGRWLAFLAAATTLVGAHLLWLAGYLPPPPARASADRAVFSVLVWFVVGGLVSLVINLTSQAWRNQAGALRESLSVLHKAESALRERTATLQALLDAPQETVALLAPDGKLLNINESGARRLGAAPGELVGRNLYDVLPTDLGRLHKTHIDGVFQTGEPVRFEHGQAGADMDTIIYPVFEQGDKRVTSVAILASDITERKRAESQRQVALEALRASETKFRILAESTRSAILIVQGQKMVYANPYSSTLSGYSQDELRTISFLDLIHPDHKELALTRAQARIGGEDVPQRYELKTLTKDGDVKWVDYAGVLFEHEGGPAILSTVFDVTTRKLALEELKRYQDQLEARIEERTRELRETQERMIRQEKLAAIGQLAGGVGHELRNPLGAIKNAAYFIRMVVEDPDAETQEILEVLDKEVRTADKIVSSLLDFARTQPPTRHQVDLNDVVREALSRTPLPDAPPVEVVLQLEEDLPLILADPDQLLQVLGNLMQNGIQAMLALPVPPHGVEKQERRLVVTTAVESPPWVTVSVADSGEGISEENLHKIFEPLFTTKAKGIGLGLAVVKTLVEGHGGKIGVESRLGEGTTFTVRLPEGDNAAVEGKTA